MFKKIFDEVFGDSAWHSAITDYFAQRESLSPAELCARYFPTNPSHAVIECLSLLSDEIGVPIGKLRPTDEISFLIMPLSAKNSWYKMLYETKAGDIQLELTTNLQKRLKDFGTDNYWRQIDTVADFVQAWCGETPKC